MLNITIKEILLCYKRFTFKPINSITLLEILHILSIEFKGNLKSICIL